MLSRSFYRTGSLPEGLKNSSMVARTDANIDSAKTLPGLVLETVHVKTHGSIEGHVKHTLPMRDYGANVVRKTTTPAPKTNVRKTDLGGYTYPGAGMV
jgi:hypothetical protein